MIINVRVEVPDGRHCYDCDYLAISGYCALFRQKLEKYRNKYCVDGKVVKE